MASTEKFFFFNDKIVPAAEAVLQLSDLGLFRGYGVFDYFRTCQGKPFLMPRYLQRFRSSAHQMGLSFRLSEEELVEVIGELIRLNGYPESGVRLLLTGGYSENIFSPGEPNLIIRIENSVMPEDHFFRNGIKLISTPYLRDVPTVKTTNYLEAIRLWPKVEAAGATELLYHWDGSWRECSRSNFFVVSEGVVLTPPSSQVLSGITRNKVLELARQAGIPAEERSLPLGIIRHVQEAFISGTTKRVMPVVQIDDVLIGEGKPGPVTQKLIEEFLKAEEQHAAGTGI